VRKDQRKHKRCEAREEVFVAFLIPEEPIIVGRILDMSHGGLGARYLATRKLETGPITIRIFGLNSFYMDRIESTVIYDSEISEASWSIPTVRRCGIHFEGYGSEIRTNLEKMLKAQPAW
jgi:hypothetical protein